MSTKKDTNRHTDRSSQPHIGQAEVLLAVADLFGRKWHLPILYHLDSERKRFTDLKEEISGVSGKMLAEGLDTLSEEYGVVERHAKTEQPGHVEYSLTQAGQALVPAMLALQEWASAHLEDDE
jgi:DNA-binding HxlR family transcriptional regulator